MITYLKDLKRKIKYSYVYRFKELNNPGEYHSIKAFDYYRCVFIHIPKAAGMSVNKSLFGNYGGSHKTIKFYKNLYHINTFNKYFKFTFVRNPWVRAYSTFNYLKYGGKNANERDLTFGRQHFKDINFETFIMKWLNKESMYSYEHLYPQYYFLKDENGIICCDFIGKVENIDVDFKIITKKIGINTKLYETNTSNRKSNDVLSVYTADMISKIRELYAEDIKLFQYKFNE